MEKDNKEIENRLFDVSARLEVLSGILSGLYHSALSDRGAGVAAEQKAYDWCVTYYDLVSSAIWECSKALDEQQEIIDDCINRL